MLESNRAVVKAALFSKSAQKFFRNLGSHFPLYIHYFKCTGPNCVMANMKLIRQSNFEP